MRKTEIRNIVLIALFAALMIVGAYLKIPNPFFPVYFTFQTIFSILAGLLIGSRKGAMSMTLYMAMGLAGLPVFSTPAGIHYILNPTFGYILHNRCGFSCFLGRHFVHILFRNVVYVFIEHFLHRNSYRVFWNIVRYGVIFY